MKAKRNFLWQFRRTLERELASFCIVLIDQGNRIIIRFPDATAFVAGGAEFASGVEPTLKRIASILRATKGQILVSGHTDNSPISTARFRSNWDLSSARAVSVVHFLITRAAVSPSRITAQGFADSRPLVKNDTPENQSRNRRVEISIEITSFQG
jgi:chemotaxis protein MotB